MKRNPEHIRKDKTSYVRNPDGDPIFMMDYEVGKKAITNELPILMQEIQGEKFAKGAIVIAILYFLFFLYILLDVLVFAVVFPSSMIAYIFINKEFQ